MLHKISDFVNKIKVMNEEAHKLYVMKYHTPKASGASIDNQIQNIQAMAHMIANDKSDYRRLDDDTPGRSVNEKIKDDDGGW
jgi:hypothetical protein|tara:strand:+ start:1240 stop:1485 length:246 start_codon:yes stop_codon:yes gene_type:complete